MDTASTTDLGIAFVLNTTTGWHLQVTQMEGAVNRVRVDIPVSADLVMTIAHHIDQFVPQASQNAQRANVMTFAAIATHRVQQQMQRERDRVLAVAAELDRRAAAFQSTLISLLKQQGSLEKTLAAQDINVSWHEFPSGQPLLEALNVGNIDLSADVADTVPVFARAAIA